MRAVRRLGGHAVRDRDLAQEDAGDQCHHQDHGRVEEERVEGVGEACADGFDRAVEDRRRLGRDRSPELSQAVGVEERLRAPGDVHGQLELRREVLLGQPALDRAR
ncbi:MAG: hypothetical protein M3075_11810 [Candidatus Dormibacteraeota bacterium]|nr:hypothetical protein [Candidatus Dormibacteraeota bacterium]